MSVTLKFVGLMLGLFFCFWVFLSFFAIISLEVWFVCWLWINNSSTIEGAAEASVSALRCDGWCLCPLAANQKISRIKRVWSHSLIVCLHGNMSSPLWFLHYFPELFTELCIFLLLLQVLVSSALSLLKCRSLVFSLIFPFIAYLVNLLFWLPPSIDFLLL